MSELRFAGLTDYFSRYIPGRLNSIYEPDGSMSSIDEFALSHMHYQSCYDYLLSSDTFALIGDLVGRCGLPHLMLFDMFMDDIEGRVATNTSDSPLVFDDSGKYSTTMHNLLRSVHSNYIYFAQQYSTKTISDNVVHSDKLKSLVLTSEQLDAIELHSFLNGYTINREDGLSLSDDKVFSEVFLLFQYINTRCDGYLIELHALKSALTTYSYSVFVNELQLYLNDEVSLDILDSGYLHVFKAIKYYPTGADFFALLNFIFLLEHSFPPKRLARLDCESTYQSIDPRLVRLIRLDNPEIKCFSSLVSPSIKYTRTLVSSDVDLNHLDVRVNYFYLLD